MLSTPARSTLALLLPLILAACSTPSTPITPAAFYGDGLDHSWTATADEGQKVLNSLTGGLKTQGVNLGLSLSITATNGWGPIGVNQSNGETAPYDGHPLTMKGKTYATGLGVHGDSEIHIEATGLQTPACTRFKADIGIDDEVGVNGKFSSVVFQVFADGEKLYDSGLVTGSTPTKAIDLPVGGKSDLRFVVTHGPDLNYYDHADWAGAILDCSDTQSTPITPGKVVGWGSSSLGETTSPAGLTGVKALSAGGSHSLALKSDGTVVAWGDNTYGQRDVPTGLKDVKAISAGDDHSIALRNDGRVVVWGSNAYQQLDVPAGLTSVQAISAGGIHSLALKTDGTVVAWGNNASGQLDIPAGLDGVKAIAAGQTFSLALKEDGTVVSWGATNIHGELAVPVGLGDVKAIAAGGYVALALKNDGTVVGWGLNYYGQANIPRDVNGHVKAIDVGAYHSLLLKDDGTVVALGNNDLGQTIVPAGLNHVTAIAAGFNFNLALTTNP